jgi:Na+/H+-translocating membrane pyrophosphatase
MTHQPPEVRERTDMLDSLGNTTAATGKGFAIGSAALTALALLAAYMIAIQGGLERRVADYVIEEGREVAYVGQGVFAMESEEDPGKTVAGILSIDYGRDVALRQLEAGGEFNPVEQGIGEAPRAVRSGAAPFRLQNGDEPPLDFEVVRVRDASMARLLGHFDVTLMNPRVLCGLFLGVMLVFVFCSMTMNAVGRAAYQMMGEARRQFELMRGAFKAQGMEQSKIDDPQQWPFEVTHEGKRYPDYASCVAISTRGALKEMVIPSLMAVAVPIAVGLILGVAGVMGMLAGALISGFAVAIFMANAGGAWDNAKKLLESYGRITARQLVDDPQTQEKLPAQLREPLLHRAQELCDTGHGEQCVYGKGSDDHKATVVGDTVGDPFKDTSGPSLNILIKLLSSVAVVFSGLTVRYGAEISAMLGLD